MRHLRAHLKDNSEKFMQMSAEMSDKIDAKIDKQLEKMMEKKMEYGPIKFHDILIEYTRDGEPFLWFYLTFSGREKARSYQVSFEKRPQKVVFPASKLKKMGYELEVSALDEVCSVFSF